MAENAKKMIGGMFALPEFIVPRQNDFSYDFLSPSNLFLANARSSLYILAEQLRSKAVWLPSYFCPVMLKDTLPEEVKSYFFPIDKNLKKVMRWDWVNKVAKNDLVVFIDYFGFPFKAVEADRIKEKGAWILEDASQAMFHPVRMKQADFVVISPRKFVGTPDGGILISKCDVTFENTKLQDPPTGWWIDSLVAAESKKAFDKGLTQDKLWYSLFNKQEQFMPVDYYSMNDLSKFLLNYVIDFNETKEKRRTNYLILLETLKSWALCDILDEDTVPLGFPVIIDNRDAVRESLYTENIYPPVHWKLQEFLPAEFNDSLELSGRIMTLPCDQRYNAEDMRRLAEVFITRLKQR